MWTWKINPSSYKKVKRQQGGSIFVHIPNQGIELWCVSLQFMFDRPYSRTLEAEADKVGLQFAAKVTTTDWFY